LVGIYLVFDRNGFITTKRPKGLKRCFLFSNDHDYVI